ncbi:MAG: hypothetical protein AB7G39_19070, partial [Alphaproteobacteria bacterium]
ALARDRGLALAHLNLGNLLQVARCYEVALRHSPAAAAARPDWYLPHANAGNALARQDRTDEAREAYGRALGLGAPEGLRFRRDLLLPVIAASAAQMTAARQRYAAGLAALEADPPPLRDPVVEAGGSRFFLAYAGMDDRPLQARLAHLYLRCRPDLGWVAPHCRPGAVRRPGRRRIVVVSRFLFDHSIGRLAEGLLLRLARQADLSLFDAGPVPDDAVHRRLVSGAASHAQLPDDLAEARAMIATAEADLVFYPEIGMHAPTYFLAFARLAPVQCVSYGHPVTTGIPTVDAFLSCAAAEVDAADADYSERLVRLPGLPFAFARPPEPDDRRDRADFGLPPSGALYLMAQNLFKLHPDMDAAFAAILKADPAGHVVLLDGHDSRWSAALRKRFSATLGGAAGRILFLPRQGHSGFMRLLQLADVGLDSFPFSGGTTTYQALAMGLPVVTLPGRYLRGRVSLAIYERMGLRDCVARDAADYAGIATRLATDAGYAAAMRRRIGAKAAGIFDDAAFLEAAEAFLMTA